ncbi:ABC transporter substrate-binding protein [Paracandidimonas soli]|uniref:ABC-type nitrate/sulfonate/bicarbonate transport system substrate-binding protein n=1 Tax=Paracandidimonas soli TaxID=1917182 RepID=A0A4R3VJC6_9BURK|nr:ABC transporter substrate-binding protein [Paracandidimonas soli]TCV03105.1 ABC-type nitrate/sulfonate/bicarbonate transport system substrate-binding protein [Paracandidimonas soli]
MDTAAHKKNLSGGISRRDVLKTAAAGMALGTGLIGMPAIARTRNISITLPWVVNGSNFWPIVGKQKGFFSSRGINLSVSRGNGSVAAAQAVGNGQFDLGVVFFGGVLVNIARGLPLQILSTVAYDSTMGNIVLADSPIQDPKDLTGKRIGIVATSAEAPYWPAFAEKTGIDLSKTTRQQLDARMVERALIEKQVDATTGIATSSLPVLKSLGVDVRFIPWSKYGVNLYASQIIAPTKTVESDPELCQAVVDGILESVIYTLKNPEESLEILYKEQPEIGLTKGGKENAILSQGLAQATMMGEEMFTHGMGHSDLAKIDAMIKMAADAGALPEGAPLPKAEQIATNRFVGKLRIEDSELATIRQSLAPYIAMTGG